MKRQPPKSPYYKYDFSVCTPSGQFDPLFIENVLDISDALVEIFRICGIPTCKARIARSIVVKAFQFYDVKRHRFCVKPEEDGSIHRKDIVDEFQCRCWMSRLQGLLAYALLKRVMKAFFLQTPDHSIRSAIIEALVIKERRYAWEHAARKSIRVFEHYRHAFFKACPNYKERIFQTYRELYERLYKRADPIIVEDYHPRGCRKRIIIGTQSPPKYQEEKQKCVQKCQRTNELKEYLKTLPPKRLPIAASCFKLPLPCNLICPPKIAKKKYENVKSYEQCEYEEKMRRKRKEAKNVDSNLPRCYQCDCPKIICDCDIDPTTGIVATDCSQGPFQCQWVRMDKAERPDPFIRKPEFHECPVDCLISYSSSDSAVSDCCKCPTDDEDKLIISSSDECEDIVYASSDNEEKLEKLMKKDLPKRNPVDSKGTCNTTILRRISKLPEMQPKSKSKPKVIKNYRKLCNCGRKNKSKKSKN
uniref:Uncharacterized protein n=1 Tax=Glossina palpalis gambiensis TaxID=67801 RepID=A0A1B0AVN6_9MUSC